VLQAPYELVYQLALLSSELQAIFAKAPCNKLSRNAESGKRRDIEGDCPICFSEFDAKSPESIVWCKAMCGQNIHQECFDMWAKTKSQNVTCPFCRTKWHGDAEKKPCVKKNRGVVREGYVNVADQLDISPYRGTYFASVW
jgi:hypothetical protein